eukprot:3315035-Lingulodinium_polyedra.AAC.1
MEVLELSTALHFMEVLEKPGWKSAFTHNQSTASAQLQPLSSWIFASIYSQSIFASAALALEFSTRWH